MGLYGRDSNEEIAKLLIDVGAIEKVELINQRSKKTIFDFYGDKVKILNKSNQQTFRIRTLSSYRGDSAVNKFIILHHHQ